MPRRSPIHQTMERSMLLDEDNNAREAEGESIKALKRRRRQEAPHVTIESSEGTESIELLKF